MFCFNNKLYDLLELRRLVDEAISKFNALDATLLKNNLSERCICARFAYHLQTEILQNYKYKDYFVDVEYNRGANGQENAIKGLEGKRIYVDLIVHKRLADPICGFDNLICIEFKKSNDTRGT